MTQDCDYPWGFNYSTLAYMITLITLFSNFYVQSYIKKKSLAASPKDKQQSYEGATMAGGARSNGRRRNGDATSVNGAASVIVGGKTTKQL